jgi:hypothetical protein
MGEEAARTAERFNWRRCAEDTAAAYRAVIERHGASSRASFTT